MKLCEVIDVSKVRKFLLLVAEHIPWPFKPVNGAYVAVGPGDDLDYELRVVPGARNKIHVRLTYPDTFEGEQAVKSFNRWRERLPVPTISNLRRSTERYENHPGLVFLTFTYTPPEPLLPSQR